ncbi:urease accessory protein UreF [Kribbella sp. GL6]|uniref:urease accessory protein UreF n=1 Tax=Kribbella sp. GL6 TaxID=3419765 RepID=UPI003D047303
MGADGKRLTDVAEYARDRLHTVTRVEAATATVTRHLTLLPPTRVKRLHPDPRLDEGGVAGLGVVERAWAARTCSQVVRGVSRRQGRLLLRLAVRVWPEVGEYLPVDREVPRPIVLGVVAAVNGLSAEQLVRVVAYDDVQTVVSASLKLLPVDPAEAAGWLAGLHDEIERLVKDVAPLTEPDAIPADGAPLIDLFAHQHATERMRLFHA